MPGPIVELITPTDTLPLYSTPDINGWVYDNVTLDRWYEPAEAEIELDRRPNAHGAYGLGTVYLNEHNPIVNGQYYGTSAGDALLARNRLGRLFNEGKSLTMRVTDELGMQTRTVWLVERHAPFRHDFSHFPFDIVLVAPDPRRYGPTVTDSDGMPAGGSGLVWNLGTAGSGLFLDWGTAGVLGQVSFINTGDAATYPRFEVGGPGAFASGFRITEIETGRELTFERTTNDGEIIVFDSRTQRATLNGNDVTGDLSSRDWFEIPAGATYRYQITPLGAVTGAPTFTMYAAPASL